MTLQRNERMKEKHKYGLIAIVIILVIVAIGLHYKYVSKGWDWIHTFRPATLTMLNGQSPYYDLKTDGEFWNPPWTLIPFIPIALLPERFSATVFFFIALTSYFILILRFKAKLASLLLFFFSPPIMADLATGNIAWLIMLGYIMPPQIGLFFVLIKPQIGGIVALFWLVEAWREGGFKKVVKTFFPVTMAYILSFLVYGFWIIKLPSIIGGGINLGLFPYSIPLGLVLLTRALRQREIKYAYMASPFIAPYAALNSLGTVILGLISSTWDTFATTVGLWIMDYILVKGYRK
jgi:hypothetical protein